MFLKIISSASEQEEGQTDRLVPSRVQFTDCHVTLLEKGQLVVSKDLIFYIYLCFI